MWNVWIWRTMYSLPVFSPSLTKHPSGSGCTPLTFEPAGADLPILQPGAHYILLVTGTLHRLFLKDVQLPLCLNTNETEKKKTEIIYKSYRKDCKHLGEETNIFSPGMSGLKPGHLWTNNSLADNAPEKPTPVNTQDLSELPEMMQLSKKGTRVESLTAYSCKKFYKYTELRSSDEVILS